MDMQYQQHQHQQHQQQPNNNVQISGNPKNQGPAVPHEQHQQLASLNTMISALQQSVKELTSIVAEQRGELCDAKARLSESESTIHTLRGRITKLETGFLEMAAGGESLRENKNSHKRKRQRNENDKKDDENDDENNDDDDVRAISPVPRKKAEILRAPGAPSSSSASSEVSSATSIPQQAVATVAPMTRKKTCAATVTTRMPHKLPVTYFRAKAIDGIQFDYCAPEALLDLCHNTGILIHARCLPFDADPFIFPSRQEQVVVRTSLGEFETDRSVTITEMCLPQLHPVRKFASPQTARLIDAKACKFDVILGGDFLRQKEIQVDLSSNSISWLGEVIKMDGFEFFEPKTAATSSPS